MRPWSHATMSPQAPQDLHAGPLLTSFAGNSTQIEPRFRASKKLFPVVGGWGVEGGGISPPLEDPLGDRLSAAAFVLRKHPITIARLQAATRPGDAACADVCNLSAVQGVISSFAAPATLAFICIDQGAA